MFNLIRVEAPEAELTVAARAIQQTLNPQPAGQQELNVPCLPDGPLEGVQHKYRETVLYFPAASQTCHAYCTYCFRWAQFVGLDELKFASRQADRLVAYLKVHPEVTSVLITGGDSMVMKTQVLRRYVEPLLDPALEHIESIRFGTKATAYWPYRFVTDPDADDLLRLFAQIRAAGKHVALMAHYSHPRELETPILLRKQVRSGAVPYYMFVERDTGPRNYFEVPLVRALEIFNEAYRDVSGLSRSIRGPSMSATPGKVVVDGVTTINGEEVFVLKFLQARNPEWVGRLLFAKFNPQATWLDDLEPAFGEEEFFFSEGLRAMQAESLRSTGRS
jgi:L-lysine 2,3-aminomutase